MRAPAISSARSVQSQKSSKAEKYITLDFCKYVPTSMIMPASYELVNEDYKPANSALYFHECHDMAIGGAFCRLLWCVEVLTL